MSRDSLRRVVRTFLIAFLGIAIPGALSWLHDLTEWANGQGQTPFPDARSLAFLAVAAICAGFIALLNLLVVWVEDSTGRGFLRAVPPKPPRTPRGQRGETMLGTVLPLLVLAVVVVTYVLTLCYT